MRQGFGEVLGRALDQPSDRPLPERPQRVRVLRRRGPAQAAGERQDLVATVDDPDSRARALNPAQNGGDILLRTADAAFSGAVDATSLFQQSAKKAGINITIKREPNDGYWSSVWNKQPFSASYWGGRPTQDQTFSTAYISTADWNDTRFKNPKFDKLVLDARGELDKAKRAAMYKKAGTLLSDEGGLINPMFNNFINAYRSDRVAGWHDNPNQDMMNGNAAVLCWQA